MKYEEAIEWLDPETSPIKISASESRYENTYAHIQEAFQVGINAIKKQIARKPVKKKKDEGLTICYFCPSCGKYFGTRGSRSVILFKKETYCQKDNCGQKIDWSKEQ